MKRTFLIQAILLSLVVYGCTPGRCTCSKQFIIYGHDSVIYYPNYNDTATYTKTKDSLTNLYGIGKDSFINASAEYNSDLLQELENQGFRCACAK